jgi:dTDP-4-dehydrorhamnose reductase
MNVVIFGAGFIGKRLAEAIPGSTLVDADIADRAVVQQTLAANYASVIINAAGKTGRPNVDWCETHQQETFRSNVTGALVLADVAAETGAYLLHLGSGCIFYGMKRTHVRSGFYATEPWLENDHANPSAYYSRTKYAADLVLSRLPNVGIARLRMPIDGRPGPRNLITKLAGYREIIDVENSVTVIDDFVHVVRELISQRATGVFHVTNPGVMRHSDLIALYQELVDPSYVCTWITPEQLVERGLAAKARSNCILASSRLADLGIEMRPIDVALRDAMTKYAENHRR